MRTAPCEAIWFDVASPKSCRLRIAIAPLSSPPRAFWVRFDAKRHALVHFTRLGFIKGQLLYEASEWRLACDPDQPLQDPSLLLAGPWQGASLIAP